MQLQSNLIGGGMVRRAFMLGERKMTPGTELTGDEIRAMRNHKVLIEGGRIDVWPATASNDTGDCFVVHLGRGKYDVIRGRKLNTEPLTKTEAEFLASTKH